MTSQSAQLEVLLGGVWTTVPLLLEPDGSTITRGHDPYGTWPRPSSVECTINNDSLNYDPSLPTSLLYGLAGRNSQVRFSSHGTWRLWAEAGAWSPDRTPEHSPGIARGLSWVDLTAQGVLARIGLWAEPLRSPMYGTISSRATCIGHWALEDDRDAVRAAASIGLPATVRGGVSFGESETPQGAGQSVKVATGSVMNGRFLPASITAGWQIAFSMRLPSIPATGTYTDMFSWRSANGDSWYWAVNNNTYQLRVIDHLGATIYSGAGVTFGVGAEPNQWVTFRLKASQVGGNVQLEPAWYAQNGIVFGTTDTYAGSVSVPQQWFQFGTAVIDGAHFSHVFAVTGLTDNLLSSSALQSFDGYNTEPAGVRFGRLCTENGIAGFFIGASTDTQPMGPQQPDTFLNLLKDIRSTDDCRIDDERFTAGALTMRTRRALYNQTPALTLTYPSQVAIPFRKMIDTVPIRNVITVKNQAGGEFTEALLTGAASILPPPLGVGQVPQQVDVNVADEEQQLDDLASHWLAKLTMAAPRFEAVTVDLLANPGLKAAATAVREGDLLRVTGYAYDPIDLLVVGIQEKVGPGALAEITFQTEPYDLYRIGVYDDGVWRWDTRTMTLQGGGVTAVATALTTNVVDPNDVLTTAAGSLPLDMVIGQGDGTGEVVRVTAVTAAGAGPTYAQILTVTRNINGLARAWPAGMQLNVHDYRRWGL